MDFPQRLIDGYRAFSDGRLQSEQHRYRESVFARVCSLSSNV